MKKPFFLGGNAFKAWDKAIKDTRVLLTAYKTKTKTFRENRRMMIKSQIEGIELATDPNSPPPLDLVELKSKIREEELLSPKASILWTREYWTGKIDKPNKNIFALLKKKKTKDFVPLLKKEDGTVSTDHKNNLLTVLEYYGNTPPQRGPDHTRARNCNKKGKKCPFLLGHDVGLATFRGGGEGCYQCS